MKAYLSHILTFSAGLWLGLLLIDNESPSVSQGIEFSAQSYEQNLLFGQTEINPLEVTESLDFEPQQANNKSESKLILAADSNEDDSVQNETIFSSFEERFNTQQISALDISESMVNQYFEEPQERINNSSLNDLDNLNVAIDTIISEDDSNVREILLAMLSGAGDEAKQNAIFELLGSQRDIDHQAAAQLIINIDDEQSRLAAIDGAIRSQLNNESVLHLLNSMPDNFTEHAGPDLSESIKSLLQASEDRHSKQILMKMISPDSELGNDLFYEAINGANSGIAEETTSSLSALNLWVIERPSSFSSEQVNEIAELSANIAADHSQSLDIRIEALGLMKQLEHH